MSKIDDKYNDLKSHGFDLGAALGAEQSAGYGGTYRQYKNGNIYWHPVMGASAHEVHGGILTLYTANGGPDVNAKNGIRQFGFPLTDEVRTPADQTPYSDFETGAIYWTQGTGGCVMYGGIHTAYKANGQTNWLGLPISNLVTAANGAAVYCERGALWTTAALGNSALVASFQPPLLGNALTVGTTGVELNGIIQWATQPNNLTHNLSLVPPSVLSDLWRNCLYLTPVGGGTPVLLNPTAPNLGSMSSLTSVPISLIANGPLTDSTLYDIQLRLPNGYNYTLSPHCVYAKNSWDNFGVLHATDIHLSERNQLLGAQLAKDGLADAAAHYANFQDNFRDFIKYANHLHSLGMADAVMATGDLIDYIIEPGDDPYSGNFARLRRMILGQAFDAGVSVGEELKIPFYGTFGNHDYRPNEYYLSFDINAEVKDLTMDEYSSHNLTPEEAVKVQGGSKSFGVTDFSDAMKMLQVDTTGAAYAYYAKYFSPARSFIVNLGASRMVVLDTLYDAGIPQINGWEDLVKFAYEYENNSLGTATNTLINGCGDCEGLTQPEYQMLGAALTQAGNNGVVIVGMHVPPFSPVGGEYPYYLRETIHPTGAAGLTTEYLSRNSLKTDGWSLSGTPHFRTGELGNGHGLDNGVIAEYAMDFIRLLAGIGLSAPRPVDLFLCGHHHDRTEYRLKWNGSDVQYFMDFYLEEPATYYSTVIGADLHVGGQTLPKGTRLKIAIDPKAPASGSITTAILHDGPASEVQGTIALPPYPTPLDTAANVKQWWIDHRPIVAQTAAMGPIDPRQRYDPFWKKNGSSDTTESKTQPGNTTQVVRPQPDPTFNGFRLVQVSGSVIQKVRYVTFAELRSANFSLPWEPHKYINPIQVGKITGVLGAVG